MQVDPTAEVVSGNTLGFVFVERELSIGFFWTHDTTQDNGFCHLEAKEMNDEHTEDVHTTHNTQLYFFFWLKEECHFPFGFPWHYSRLP